ncbi:MAG: hypothetical protein QMD77_02760 [Patescibacteria group bacterium]|nr:hypothetical protein [Patescibacteria group bacterium]
MDLLKNILNTITYYDILDYPLTSFEVWKYLIGIENCELRIVNGNSENKEYSLGEIIEVLENKEPKKYIEEFRGFYFLKGWKELVEKRIQNDKNSIAKHKIAERVVWWLRFIPFVRMVAVTGTLAMKNPEKESDIDFFVVLEKERIWIGRLLVTLAVHLLGRRRYGKKIKNRICLNYFVTTESLKIKRQDLFAANEYSFIYPLFGFSVYKKFGEANIGWIKKYKPNFEFSDLKPAKYFVEVSPRQRGIQRLLESLINSLWGDRIESWLRKLQIARIERNPLTHKEGAYVEANDENLIFLPEPQGPKVLEKFRVLTSDKDFL